MMIRSVCLKDKKSASNLLQQISKHQSSPPEVLHGEVKKVIYMIDSQAKIYKRLLSQSLCAQSFYQFFILLNMSTA